jgi:N utilization substance protein B
VTGQASATSAKEQRSVARLAAVQALYQMDAAGTTLPMVIAEFEKYRLGEDLEGQELRPADRAFFRYLLRGVVKSQRRIDPIIHSALPPTWPLTRIDLTLRAVLRCGVFELLSDRVPRRVVIDEYVGVANAFFTADEPGLVNGLLDQVAKAVGPRGPRRSRVRTAGAP